MMAPGRGDGAENFADWTGLAMEGGERQDLAAADFDGDGIIDIAVVLLEFEGGGEMVALCGGGEGYDARQARASTEAVRIAPEAANMYRAEVEAFSRAVLEGTEPPVGGAQGVWNQRVLAAAYDSARTGRAIRP
jgi:hypothetical protein